MNAVGVTYKILYNNVNITTDISDHLLSLNYNDKVAGESDDMELTLEDSDLVWQNAWYPEKGATISAEIIAPDSSLKTGDFEIDEIELQSSKGGDIVTIRALSAPITRKLRTKKSSSHENKSLREIVQTIAARHGLTVQGTIPNIVTNRSTQHYKGDLAYLQKLALDYGCVFSVKGKLLIFHDQKELESNEAAISLDKTDLISCTIKDKTAQVYKAASLKYHNPADKELEESTTDDDPDVVGAEDDLELRDKAENEQQAEAKANAALHRANTTQIEGNIVSQGNVLLVSGNNIELTGFGKMSGKFNIIESTHTLTRGEGYVTSASVKKVAVIAPAKFIPKRPKIVKHGGLIFIPDPVQ